MTIKDQQLFLAGRRDAINAVKPACNRADYIAGYKRGIEYLGQRVAKGHARTASRVRVCKSKVLSLQTLGRSTKGELK